MIKTIKGLYSKPKVTERFNVDESEPIRSLPPHLVQDYGARQPVVERWETENGYTPEFKYEIPDCHLKPPKLGQPVL